MIWISALALLTSIVGVLIGEWRHRSSFRLAWYKEVVAWARECVRVLSAAHELSVAHIVDETYMARRRHEILEVLTSLIDEGRFLFENDRSTGHGADKPYAYQGHRPDLLNYLVGAYDAIRATDFHSDVDATHTDHLVMFKELFVSDVQKVIEPNWFSRVATVTPNTKTD